ncbi:MAG: DUF4465 domain-containing protein [Prevotella ruminicola]|jgi:hypothetical protein|uniref:DUF4465 domain-containing protein n=1 Tax=Xylanibacter ruminicola TaxID=839 RepID=A0A9D5SAL7_XYLRU|nr:DUF4465 domain-containing protein [Xylanibacter ruminicola]
MKTNKLFGLAVLACGFALSFTSCTNADNPIGGKRQATVTFEKKTLGADGYWCGDETGEKFDNWGSEAFACQYKEKGVTFPANYTPSWASWSGFAISNRTATTYKNLNPDQFNSAVGAAKSGNNYCVVYTFGETIDFGRAVTLKGFWFTNEAWAVDAILNGDGITPGKFEKDDWFKCIVTANLKNGTTKDVEIYLAKDGEYVKDWQFCDFQSLEGVESLSFAFDSTKKNAYGATTPTYMCIDDIEFEY